MLAVLGPALWAIAAWLVRSVLVKTILYIVILAFVTEAMQYVVGKLPQGDGGIATALSALSPGAWYFMDMMQVGVGLGLVLSAVVLRFAIRRIPFIG